MGMRFSDLLAVLRDDGWEEVRCRGSHHQFKHSRKPGTVTLAGRPGVEVPTGTMNAILKTAGIKRDNRQ